jgi:hypothetical protein
MEKNETDQNLIHADADNLLGREICPVIEKIGDLLLDGKQVCLEISINVGRTKYRLMFISRQQNRE